MGRSTDLGMSICRKQGLFLSVNVDIRMAGKKQHTASMWKEIDVKTLIFTNQLHFLITHIGMHST